MYAVFVCLYTAVVGEHVNWGGGGGGGGVNDVRSN